MNKLVVVIIFSLLGAIIGAEERNVMPNRSPNMAGLWTESSGRVWKSTQRGNLFTWIQEKTNRVAKGLVVAESPDKPSSWLVFITFDGKIHWQLEFDEDFSTLTAQNDVFKRKVSTVSSCIVVGSLSNPID